MLAIKENLRGCENLPGSIFTVTKPAEEDAASLHQRLNILLRREAARWVGDRQEALTHLLSVAGWEVGSGEQDATTTVNAALNSANNWQGRVPCWAPAIAHHRFVVDR
ncbi:hypothetical protein DJICPGNB_11180 [Escherichia coli]|nr:hypothetical protein DJICPGNB_11180 [Escherichia coli]